MQLDRVFQAERAVDPLAKVDHHLVSILGDFQAFGSITMDFEFRVTITLANAIVFFTPGPSKTMSVVLSNR